MMIALTLLIMAIEDGLTMHVNDTFQLLLLLEVLITRDTTWFLIAMSLLLYSMYYIYEKKKQVKIGGADIKIFCSLLLLGLYQLSMIVFWACLIGIVYCLLRRRKIIPFVPFIWLGYTIVNI